MATETILSPGVLLQEVDKSFINPGVDPSGIAVIGPAVKGPIEIPTRITNYQEYKSVFGTTIESASKDYVYYTSVAVKNYFQNGGTSAIVVRTVKDADTAWSAATSSRIAPRDTGDTSGDGPFTLETLSKGSNLNTSGSYANGAAISGSVDNFKWEILSPNTANGTFTVVVRRGDDTTKKPIVLESFTECSLDPLSENYISRRIGDQYYDVDKSDPDNVIVSLKGEFPNKSKYVRVSAVSSSTYEYRGNSGLIGSASDGTPYDDLLPQTGSGHFGAGRGDNLAGNPLFGNLGSNADAIQGLTTGDYTSSISILKNKEDYKFKTIIAPGLTQQNHGTTVDLIIENTVNRGDSLYVLDLTSYNAGTGTVTGEAGELDTSFAAAYWPWTLVRSSELDRNVWCPASTVIPGVYSKNDSLAAPWFAPAGLTRGGITNVVRVEKKLPKATRDTLYANKVNPIATFPGQGIVVFGQKTLQNAKSALDRVNVRRMLLDVKDTIDGFAKSVLFEQNTDTTRNQFKNLVNPFLENIVQRNGLYAYQVKMDGQNNTPDIIDRNQLVGQVFLQPTKTAEFIVLDFVLTQTGASFTD